VFQISDIFTLGRTGETQALLMLQAVAWDICAVVARARALPGFAGSVNGVLVDRHDSDEWARRPGSSTG
jgi:hypothetical protein